MNCISVRGAARENPSAKLRLDKKKTRTSRALCAWVFCRESSTKITLHLRHIRRGSIQAKLSNRNATRVQRSYLSMCSAANNIHCRQEETGAGGCRAVENYAIIAAFFFLESLGRSTSREKSCCANIVITMILIGDVQRDGLWLIFPRVERASTPYNGCHLKVNLQFISCSLVLGKSNTWGYSSTEKDGFWVEALFRPMLECSRGNIKSFAFLLSILKRESD